MTATLTEFTATDAGLPVASQEPSLAAGPSRDDRDRRRLLRCASSSANRDGAHRDG